MPNSQFPNAQFSIPQPIRSISYLIRCQPIRSISYLIHCQPIRSIRYPIRCHMTLESKIAKNIEKLPESAKQAILLYTEFLASKYAEESKKLENQTRKRPLAGSMKGTFVLPLPEDFDAAMTMAPTQKQR